jgi:hypothetical protein
MKRLLLGPALIAPLALFGCSNWGTKVPELPKVEVPEVVRQIPLEDFEHFPPVVPGAPGAREETQGEEACCTLPMQPDDHLCSSLS